MKKICFLILTALLSTVTMAQDAKSVLDKAAANITVKEGVKANFTMTMPVAPSSSKARSSMPPHRRPLYGLMARPCGPI